MTIGEYIKKYREEHELSGRAFASQVGISPQYVVNLERGVNNDGKPCTPTVRMLAKIAKGTGRSEAELLTMLHEDVAINPPGLVEKYEALDARGKARVDDVLDEEYARCTAGELVYIRHYLVPAAAGYASPIEGEDYEDIPLPDGAPAGADFCITVRGDSMEPYIPDGSLAYVKRGDSLQEFDVGIFYVDGDALVKQWCVDYGGTLHLLSANPKREDANRQIPKGSTSTVVCFGKVLLDRRLPAPIYQ
jgi:transcriptional regulator with XRE-family HTH domain